MRLVLVIVLIARWKQRTYKSVSKEPPNAQKEKLGSDWPRLNKTKWFGKPRQMTENAETSWKLGGNYIYEAFGFLNPSFLYETRHSLNTK